MANPLENQLDYPFGERLPEAGRKIEIAPGVYWIRMPLPFALNHINLWLLRDRYEGREGWTAVDCGLTNDTIIGLWQQVIANELDGLPIVRVLVTHTHPDHIGLAHWLTEVCDPQHPAPLWMTHGEYAAGRVVSSKLPGSDSQGTLKHYLRHGLSDAGLIDKLGSRKGNFEMYVPRMPLSFRRMMDGQSIPIGNRTWRVIVGTGHSPEHAALYADEGHIMISGDMLLPRISTNVSVHPMEPEANPVQWFLDSLGKFEPLPEDTFVLPSHGKPFRKHRVRIAQLRTHHADRLDAVRKACRERPTTAVDILPILFERTLDSYQFTFAMGEAIAHLHALWFGGEIRRDLGDDGVYRFSADGA